MLVYKSDSQNLDKKKLNVHDRVSDISNHNEI